MLPFLLEIGTEEIPDWMIPSALEFLREKFDGSDVTVDGTGRRLVLRASLEERTADKEEVVTGPPAAVQGKPLEGFCAKQGITPDALTVVETAKGKYWSFVKKTPGRAMKEILAESLPALITSIPWPKTMYWPSMGGPRFIRPIRWIVALLGNDVVEFECANVKSSNVTYGHRRLGARGPLTVTVDSYEQVLADNFVIVSAAKRRAKIELEVAAVAASKGLHAKGDAKLLEVLTYITEYPTAIIGSFDASYLSLPSEVLVTVMRHHQKYFSVEEPDGELAPHFIAIMNIPADPDGHVVYGNERVLRARFNDARFFYDVDQKRTLAEREQDLSHVTFQAKVGNYLEKTARVAALAGELGGDDAAAAAHLCKADLTTEMVKEFTDLQGIVGGLYAKAQGASEAVARAIYEHYKPLSMDGSIPGSDELWGRYPTAHEARAAQAVSVADKIDTLRSCFGVGMIPSGSKDPFALRRAAQGVVKILAEGDIDPDVPKLIGGNEALRDFFFDRLQHYLSEKGIPYDISRAVVSRWRPAESFGVKSLLQVVNGFDNCRRTNPEMFYQLSQSIKRVRNIIKGNEDLSGAILLQDLTIAEEVALVRQLNVLRDQTESLFSSSRFDEYFNLLVESAPIVTAFIDNLRVLDVQEHDRTRRIRILSRTATALNAVADFSEIVTS